MPIRKCADQQEFPIHRHIYELAYYLPCPYFFPHKRDIRQSKTYNCRSNQSGQLRPNDQKALA